MIEFFAAITVFLAAHADRIDSAEINPLRAYPDRCLGLDALIIPRKD